MLCLNSQLQTKEPGSVRFSTTDDYDRFLSASGLHGIVVTSEQALEESFFLGLRLNRGVDLVTLRKKFGVAALKFDARVSRLIALGLMAQSGDNLSLTPRGILLSNEVFESFIGEERSAIQPIPEASVS